MDKELFEGLLQSMKEAVAISKGEMPPSRVFVVEPKGLRGIREKAGLSQREMAQLMQVSLRTLQNWEQGRRKPTGPAQALIQIFDKLPRATLDELKAGLLT